MKTVADIYTSNIEVQERNVVNDLVHMFFDENATDEELNSFYGGEVNREAIVNDDIKRLLDDQQMLRFLTANKEKFINTYGDKNALSDFGRTVQRADAHSTEQGGIDKSDGENREGESVKSPYHEDGQGDAGTGSSDGGDETRGV